MTRINKENEETQAAWEDDKLNRKKEGKFLTNYLVNKYSADKAKNFVLNVNADWGFGKTYFLKNLAIELKEQQHQIVYFDAWKNDFSDKPMLGFIAEINTALAVFMEKDDSHIQKAKSGITTRLKKLKRSAAPIMAGFLTKQLVGVSFDKIQNLLNEEDSTADESDNLEKDVVKSVSSITTKAAEYALKEHISTQKSIEMFKVNLKDLVNYIESKTGSKLPLFILVDELDRCRPNYAIELLETIKHLFDVDGVYFIVATASHQLSHSINAIYGNNFESKRYLNRFFDQEYKLATPEHLSYCQFLWDKYIPKNGLFIPLFPNDAYKSERDENINMNAVLVNLVAQHTRASLRDIEQAVKLLQAINLTYSKQLYSLLIIYLTFCKIRHPELFAIFRVKWPKLYYSENGIKSKITEYKREYFDRSVMLEEIDYSDYRKNTSIKAKELDHVIQQMLTSNKKSMRDFNNSVSDSYTYGDRIIEHFSSMNRGYEVHNPPILDLSYYIDLVEQVGRLS